MSTELEELVGFIAHPNPQIRLTATENLVPYSTSDPALFKTDGLRPVQNLKTLVRDRPKIAQHVLTILVNLSGDPEVLDKLGQDEAFLDFILRRICDSEEINADLMAMLLANLTKWDGFPSALHRRQQSPPGKLGSDNGILNQLLDLFVKGQDCAYNTHADFDYLAYVFADLAKDASIRSYFVHPQSYDSIIPLTKLTVFTEHKSAVRRKGVASTIKNVAFDVPSHPIFLSETSINVLPYILLPITGNEDYDADETLAMLPDLQLLPPDKRRDPDPTIVQTHVETLTLLTTTAEGRQLMRKIRVYPVIRETHLRVDHDGVKEACERLVQVLMREEEGDPKKAQVQEVVDEDDEIFEV